MHKIRDRFLFRSFFSVGEDGDPFPSVALFIAIEIVFLFVSTAILLDGSPLSWQFIPMILSGVGSLFLPTYLYIKYFNFKKRINSYKTQPSIISDTLPNFYKWEEGDEIHIPNDVFRSRNKIYGYFKGIKDDGSIVLEVQRNYMGSEKDFNGEELYRPKYLEVPPKYIEEVGCENKDQQERKRKLQEKRTRDELEDSSIDEVLDEVRDEIKKIEEETVESKEELEKPEPPEPEYMRF